MMVVRAAIPVLVLALACKSPAPPAGQFLLFIDTDAPVPGDRHVLFDVLRIDVVDPHGNTCNECSRTFALTADRLDALGPNDKGVSFGLTASGQEGWSVRARLYDRHATLDGELPSDLPDGSPPRSVIDVSASVPSIPTQQVVERTLFIATDAVGTKTTTETTPGRPTSSRHGTWPGAREIPCAGTPSADEVCVPGGAFWMGDPRVASAGSRRLVVLSPYFVQANEVTVAALRKANLSTMTWSGNSVGNDIADFCTFTATVVASREQLAVNCISFADARQYCMALGADLPSEAQLEHVAGARQSSLFVWGDDDRPTCDDAVLGRGGWGLFQKDIAPCRPAQPPGGPLAIGSAARDRLMLDGGTISDLVGNLNEYVLDTLDQTDCWPPGGAYVDPICVVGSKRVVKGGAWADLPKTAAAAGRRWADATTSVATGFRCVRSAF